MQGDSVKGPIYYTKKKNGNGTSKMEIIFSAGTNPHKIYRMWELQIGSHIPKRNPHMQGDSVKGRIYYTKKKNGNGNKWK